VSPSNCRSLAVDASLEETLLIAAIRKKIKLLVDNPELRKEIGIENRKFSEGLSAPVHFKWLEAEMEKLCAS
jgi:hypothetical protein